MREIGISPRFSRDKFVPLQTKQRYSTRDISGEVFLTLFFRGFVPFLSLADFVSRDKNLQVVDLQRLKPYLEELVTATTSKDGASDAYLFSSGTLETDTTSRFFVPAVNWLRADEKGHFAPYPNHWHFTATSDKQKVYRFATIVYTHAKDNDAENAQAAPRKLKDGSIQIGNWNIKANISTAGKPSFEVRNTRKDCDASVSYKDYGATVIHDNGKKTELKDEVPELEI